MNRALEIFIILSDLEKSHGEIDSFSYKENTLKVIFKYDKNTIWRIKLND